MTWAEVVVSRHWTAAGLTMLHYLWIGALLGVFTAFVRAAIGAQRAERRYVAALGCLAMQTLAPLILFWVVLSPDPLTESAKVDGKAAEFDASILPALGTLERNSGHLPHEEASSPLAKSTTWWHSLQRRLSYVLPWVWLTGSAVMLAIVITGWIGSRRLCLEIQSLEGSVIDRQCRRIAEALKIHRQVLVAASDRIVTPVVIGVWRPTILLPLSVWSGFEPTQIEMILWHELAHVRRYDNLMNFVERVVQSVLFFQPAVWLTCRWVRLERENCCDTIALQHAASPRAYAQTLASLAAPSLRMRMALASSANHQLVARIRCILHAEERLEPWCLRVVPSLFVLVCALSAVAVVYANQGKSAISDGATGRESTSLGFGNDLAALRGSEKLALLELPLAGPHRQSAKLDTLQPVEAGNLSNFGISAASKNGFEFGAADTFLDNATSVPFGKPVGTAQVPLGHYFAADLRSEAGSNGPTVNSSDELISLEGNAQRDSKTSAVVATLQNLGGWVYFDDRGRVNEVNLAYCDTSEGRLHNDTSADSDEGLRLVAAFPHLKRLSLYRGQATDEALAAVAELKELEVISSWSTKSVTDKGIRHLAGLKNLREIYFDAGRLGDGAMAIFGTLPNLEVLRMLIGNEISDSGLRHLRGASRLRELAIGMGSKPITDAGVEHLLELTSLENLNLQDSRISPAGVAKLLSMPQLQVLIVNANEHYVRRGSEWIQVQEG